MPVYIELTTDLFSEVFEQNAAKKRSAQRAGKKSVRRPLRGLEIKEDTYSIIRVVDVSGTPIRLFDSSAKQGDERDGRDYANFLLQSVQEARMEKQQIVETFGESYIFFFGEAPRFIDVSAILLNSNDFNWEAEFWANYDAFWRGSKLTELGARLYLFYDDNVVEGYMLQAQAVKDSMNPLSVQINFRLFVTNYSNVSFVDTDDFPLHGTYDQSTADLFYTGQGINLLAADATNQSVQRGLAEQSAALAVQQSALSQFGGGGLLAAALRAGLSPGMGPMLGGGAGFGVNAATADAGGVGVSADGFAGTSGAIVSGAAFSAGVGGSTNVGGGIFSTSSYAGFSPASTGAQGAVTGPAGVGSYVQSPFYADAPLGLPYAGAPIGTNPFAPNPFAAAPYAASSYGYNPYFPNPFAPTPFSPTGQAVDAFPTDSIFGPGYSGFAAAPSTRYPGGSDPAYTRTAPLRGKIWENTDEWTGSPTLDNNADYSEPAVLSDVEDLPYSAFLLLGAYGVGLTGFASLTALGMAPRFSPGGVGIGAGAGNTVTASFGLSAGSFAGTGVGIGGGSIVSSSFGGAVGASSSIGPSGPYAAAYSQQQDGYFGTSYGTAPATSSTPYANYPGYGSGYGSALPGVSGGFAPGSSLGIGVSAGVSAGASFGGGVGTTGAAVQVGGLPTCFTLDSFPGTLTIDGGAFFAPDGTVDLAAFAFGADGSTFSQRL